MRVQRALTSGSELESWTLLGDDQVPVEPVERFLAYLASIEKSPNTIKAYAHDLKEACDEDAYRILNTPGQAVSGVDDQARRVLGRAGCGQRPDVSLSCPP